MKTGATMLECDLRNEQPSLPAAWREESRKQREQKGLGKMFSWWAPFEPDSGVEIERKGTVPLQG